MKELLNRLMCASIFVDHTSLYNVAWNLQRFPDAWLSERCHVSSLDSLDCRRSWGPNWNGTSVLGTDSSMLQYCRSLPVSSNGNKSPYHTCDKHGRNILRISAWTACKNFDWIGCVASGRGCGETGCIREFYLTQPAEQSYMAPQNRLIVTENDIYVMELCILDFICKKPNSLWQSNTTSFLCDIDPVAHSHFVRSINHGGRLKFTRDKTRSHKTL